MVVNMKGVTKIIAVVLLIIGLIVGVGIGYAVSMTLAPPTPPTPVGAPGLKGEVAIGALLPLTGVLSSYGENDRVALEFAEKEINEWLKARGEEWYIKLYVEDSATDPKTALDKLMTLHGKGIKFIIGPMSSAEVSEIKSYADANQILVISQSSTSPALAIEGDWVYRYVATDLIQGPAAARVAYEQGIRYLVQVWRGDTWGDGLARATREAFSNILKKTGEAGEVIEGVRYDPAAKEFSAEAAKLASLVTDLVGKYGKDKVGIDAIGFEEMIAFIPAAKASPILAEVKWIGSDGTAGVSGLVKERELAEFCMKIQFLNPIATLGVAPHTEKVKNAVREKLGRDPEPYAYNSYDQLWTLAIALDLVDKYDSKAVRDILPEVVKRYIGASGFIELDKAGDRAYADYELWIPWRVDGTYDWRIAGTWRGSIDKVEWADWWLEATK
ncbi:MAG: ABC transporter substrate-binding protein [Nitrososphaeria archaeon]|nr:ABC transporter substrate-binding protein [Nitrososphaeria archaeon]